jgi:hypothetical protein
MPGDIPSLRILPMSDKTPGFRGRNIEDVQTGCFLRDLPARGGGFPYPSAGLNAPAGTIVLFQYRARIIASGVFLRNERFPKPIRGCSGEMHFDPKSFRIFDPWDAEAMRRVWPGFRGFGHVKQWLNPTRYATFKKRLKHVAPPK